MYLAKHISLIFSRWRLSCSLFFYITWDYDSSESCYLGCYADGAGVEVTFPHHGTAQGDEWSGGESVLIRPQHGRYHHVTTYKQRSTIIIPHHLCVQTPVTILCLFTHNYIISIVSFSHECHMKHENRVRQKSQVYKIINIFVWLTHWLLKKKHNNYLIVSVRPPVTRPLTSGHSSPRSDVSRIFPIPMGAPHSWSQSRSWPPSLHRDRILWYVPLYPEQNIKYLVLAEQKYLFG